MHSGIYHPRPTVVARPDVVRCFQLRGSRYDFCTGEAAAQAPVGQSLFAKLCVHHSLVHCSMYTLGVRASKQHLSSWWQAMQSQHVGSQVLAAAKMNGDLLLGTVLGGVAFSLARLPGHAFTSYLCCFAFLAVLVAAVIRVRYATHLLICYINLHVPESSWRCLLRLPWHAQYIWQSKRA